MEHPFWGQENRRFVMTADFIVKAVISRLFHAYAQVYIDVLLKNRRENIPVGTSTY